MGQEYALKCSACGSVKIKDGVPVSRLGLQYLSGIVVKKIPLISSVCLDCGRVEWKVENPVEIKDKEFVRESGSYFLPFMLFALFILSLQLD